MLDGKKMAKITMEYGMASLGNIVQNDQDIKAQRMVKSSINVQEGQWVTNKKNKDKVSTPNLLIMT